MVIAPHRLQVDDLRQPAILAVEGPFQALQLTGRLLALGGNPRRQPPEPRPLRQLRIVQERLHQPVRLGELPRLQQEVDACSVIP